MVVVVRGLVAGIDIGLAVQEREGSLGVGIDPEVDADVDHEVDVDHATDVGLGVQDIVMSRER